MIILFMILGVLGIFYWAYLNYQWLTKTNTKRRMFKNYFIWILLIIYVGFFVYYNNYLLFIDFNTISIFIARLIMGIYFFVIGIKGIQLKKFLGWIVYKNSAAIVFGVMSIGISVMILFLDIIRGI